MRKKIANLFKNIKPICIVKGQKNVNTKNNEIRV